MIDQSKITIALQNMLNSNVNVRQILSEDVERNSYINELPDRCPWLGVYAGKVSYEPRSLGRHAKSWKATVSPRLVFEHVNWKSTEDCETELNEYIKIIMDALWDDPSIGGTVDMTVGYDIEYLYNETQEDSMFYQTAIITITMEVMTG